MKVNPETSNRYSFAVHTCFWDPLLAIADIWKKLVALAVLSKPTSFRNGLAYLASSFTVWKRSRALAGTSLVVIQFVRLMTREDQA